MDPNSGKLQMIQDAEVARLRGLVPVERDLPVAVEVAYGPTFGDCK